MTEINAVSLWERSAAGVDLDGDTRVQIDRAANGVGERVQRRITPFPDPVEVSVRTLTLPDLSLEVRSEVVCMAEDGSGVDRRVPAPRVAARLTVTNIGRSPLYPLRLTPLRVRNIPTLGFHGTHDWLFVREPRMKNDMPAGVRLGDSGPAAWDAARGIPETGGVARNGGGHPPTRFVSSEATVLASAANAVCFGYMPITEQLVETEIRLEGTERELSSVESSCLCDGARLDAGASISSQWLVILEAGTPEAVLADYAELLRATGAPRATADQRPPSVWCSWYYYGDGMTEEELIPNLDYLERSPLEIDVVQIDECWDQRWGDWFPNAHWGDMAALASRIASLGYRPGIWTCPFLAEPRSHLRYHRDSWLLRSADGGYVEFPMGSTRSFVLDPTNPEVLDFLESTYRRITEEWGFTYHKIDFTRAVAHAKAAFSDPTKNRAQAYRAGVEAIRRGIGDESYLNVCGGLYGPAFGIADAQRSGSDVKGSWPSPESGDKQEPCGPFTIKQNTLRFWMNRLWHNDPDAMMVRRRPEPYRGEVLSVGTFSNDEAQTIALNQYLGGGIPCTTENLPEIDVDRLELLAACLPSVGAAARPRRLHLGERFVSVYDTPVTPDAPELAPWHTVSVVNWHGDPHGFVVPLDREILGSYADASDRFLVTEYHGGPARILAAGESIHTDLIPAHGCRVFWIEAVRRGPMLAGTNGHYSMGGREILRFTPGPNGIHIEGAWPWRRALTIRVLPEPGAGSHVVSAEIPEDPERTRRDAPFEIDIPTPSETT